MVPISDISLFAPLVGIFVGAIYIALKRFGVIKDRQPSIEPRAEQMWRSEAEAQKSRADRLSVEVGELRDKMGAMQVEINALKARPDLSDLVKHFDQNHKESMEVIRETLEAIKDVSVVVLPQRNSHDGL